MELLYQLLKKNVPFKWENNCIKAFEQLKKCLLEDVIHLFSDFEAAMQPGSKRPFITFTVLCKTGLGAVLSQADE